MINIPIIKNKIIGRMLCEEIKNFSQAELERVLLPCVSGKKLLPIANEMIKNRTLTFQELNKASHGRV